MFIIIKSIKKMRQGLRHSSSMKVKNTASINMLEDRLFSKLQKLDNNNEAVSRLEDLDMKLLNNTPDALTDLIYRAKGITIENQDKITKAKKQMLRVSRKQATGTFLTGTGLYAEEREQKQQSPPKQIELDYDPEQALKSLTRKNHDDDLEQLRRMIKITDENLGGYSKQVHEIKKSVLNAANTFKSQINYDLRYKLNALQEQPTRKTSSMARIRDPRYN